LPCAAKKVRNKKYLDVFVDTFLRNITHMLWKSKATGRKTTILCCLQNPCTFNLFINFAGFPRDIDSVNSDFNQAARGRKVRCEQMVDMKWTINYGTTVGKPAHSAML